MKDYTWNDIKRKAKEMQVFRQQLRNSKIVLFGARMNGDYAYKKICKE